MYKIPDDFRFFFLANYKCSYYNGNSIVVKHKQSVPCGMQKGWAIMDIFDKLGDTLISVSKDATQKAKDLSELARLRMEIRSKEEDMNQLYQQTGKDYYATHKDDEQPEFEQIILMKNTEKVLDDLKQQLGQIKGMQKCPQCGNEMSLEADYCSKCGAKLNIFEEE